ncbi:MAG: murein biosynthesis integral membrane protein MurJ [Planctomycetota bacterium]|jgi:putative peptidoglycan lipid II flippase
MTGTGRKVFKASLVIMAAHLIFKLTGPVQTRILLRFCGEDKILRDILIFSYEIILLTFFLIWEEGLGPAFLPVFMEEKNAGGEKKGWSFASNIISLQFLLIGLMVAGVMLFPEVVVSVITDWDTNPFFSENMRRAPDIVRWIMPALFGLSIGSTTYLILNGYKKFFFAALGDSAVRIMIIVFLIAGYFAESTSFIWFCSGVFAGSIAKLLTHTGAIGRAVLSFKPSLILTSKPMRRFAILIAPLLIGIVFAKIRDIYNDGWVLSHVPHNGLLSINKIGKKLFNSIGWLLPYSASIAMYPFFCELVDKDNKFELASILKKSFQIFLILVIPITAISIALAFPVSRIFWQLKGFDLGECRLASYSTIAYTLVMPFSTLEFMLMQAFFSNRKMTTPIVLGIIFSSLSMLISYLGVIVYGEKISIYLSSFSSIFTLSAVSLIAVGLAYTLSRSLKVIAMIYYLIKVLPDLKDIKTLVFGVKMIFAGFFSFMVTYLVRIYFESDIDIYSSKEIWEILPQTLPYILFSSFCGVMFYFICIRLLCPEEWQLARDWTMKKYKSFKAE